MTSFINLKNAVAKQFARMAKHELFRVNTDKDKMWNTYLNSFPEGTNPIYKTRTEHDCNCCKQFIRTVGGVVAIIDGKIETIWDGKVDDSTYSVVAAELSKLVKSGKIAEPFLHFEPKVGVERNFEQVVGQAPVPHDHFFLNIPSKFVLRNDLIATIVGTKRADHDVLARSLNELTVDAVETVLDLIAQNSLYRGQEHKFVVESFYKLLTDYAKVDAKDKDAFVWSKSISIPASVSRVRNTSIGTLLVDLSNGVEIETAVKSFERMVAPTNYKRPTALVTEKMVKDAKAKIEELGLTSALERRYANLTDITVNNILFANRDAKKKMSADVFDDIASSASKNAKSFDKVEEISIEKFISDIVPRAESLEVFLENKHTSNLVSLVAPVDATANNLFKWDNNFSWSYNGDVTDSIKERVKAAGGSVEGVLCCRLAWDYSDDLDFHMKEPAGGHIYYANRRTNSSCGGQLDVDANGADGVRDNPVENIFYSNESRMREGIYELSVHNFNRRSSGKGFTVEVEFGGTTYSFTYEKAVADGRTVVVAKIKYSKADGFSIVESIPSTQTAKKVWNLNTQNFHNVSVFMQSPNHWNDQGVGNKHYFFMLSDCVNDGSARGFYNEFLKEELNAHRKVIEIVGSKMRTQETENQLSGVGFSSTQRNHVLVRVGGTFSRVLKVVF